MTTPPKKLGRPPAAVKKETVHISLEPDDALYLRLHFANVSEGVRAVVAYHAAFRGTTRPTGTPSKAR